MTRPSRLIIIAAILFFASPIIFAWWFKAGTMQAKEDEVTLLQGGDFAKAKGQ